MVYLDKYVGCLLGGALGDALGYPVEFMSMDQIVSEYGENGIENLSVESKSGKALISDDTQMTLFTADGLIWSHLRLPKNRRMQILRSDNPVPTIRSDYLARCEP